MKLEDIEIGRVYHYANSSISVTPYAYFLVKSFRKSKFYPNLDCMTSVVGLKYGFKQSRTYLPTPHMCLTDCIVKLAPSKKEKEILLRTIV